MFIKKCSRCNKYKFRWQYNKNRAKKDGLQYQCRPCQHEYHNKQWYPKNKKDRLKMYELLGNKCICCVEKDNIYFQIPKIKDQIVAFEKTIASGKGKDVQSAIAAKAFIKHKLNLWLKDTETNKDLIKKYENNSSLKMDDFGKEYIKIVNSLKTIDSMSKLFGEGEIFLSGGGTIIENIEKKIKANTPIDADAQKILDFMNTDMTDAEFEKKYGQTKNEFKKERKL